MSEVLTAPSPLESTLLGRIVTGWAMIGGIALCAVVLVNVLSVLGAVFGMPVPGDFELTEIGAAVSAFCFLPYCQLIGANVTADILTARASLRVQEALRALSALIAIAFSALLIWRMSAGMTDQRDYEYTTAILQLPIWMVFVPVLASLVLLTLAALATLAEAARIALGGPSHV